MSNNVTLANPIQSQNLNRKNTTLYFLLLWALYYLATFLSEKFLLSDSLFYDVWSTQFSDERISELLQAWRKWSWVNTLIVPVVLLIKLTLISACLTIGALILNLNGGFKDFFRISLIAEFIFLLPQFLKLFWFSFIQLDFSLSDIQFFYPLSALNFFDVETLESYLIYPLQLFNVFEFLYWILLAIGVRAVTKEPLSPSLKLVLSTYVVGLLLWVIVVVFLTVNLS